MPSDTYLKFANAAHKALLKASFGRIGWQAGPMPVLELITTGRKTGKPRSVMLTSPHQDGDSLLIVASRGGDDHHPAWYLNLSENPEVEVSTKEGTRREMKARIVTDDQHAELWPKVVETYKGYGGYQEKTERKIPLVYLDPV